MSRLTTVTIQLDALRANFKHIKSLAPKQLIIAMIKANAYGHGIIPISQALSEANAFGVACIEEGMLLRNAGIKQPIVLMEGLFQADELNLAKQHAFTLVVHQESHIRLLEQYGYPHPIWIKINTGMHRLGIPTTQALASYQRLQKLIPKPQWIGVMTHFADADQLHKSTTEQQIALFNSATQAITSVRSLANSAAILAWPKTHADWIRPGLILYGASPFPGQTGLDHHLQPVMTFSSQLIAIHKVNQGDFIGYGGTWQAQQDTHIGVVSVGYGDGYPQYAQNGTPVLIEGKIYPLAGRVSMDMLTVDLGRQLNCQVGAKVILWGKGLPVEHIAAKTYSSPWELLTRMTHRPNLKII